MYLKFIKRRGIQSLMKEKNYQNPKSPMRKSMVDKFNLRQTLLPELSIKVPPRSLNVTKRNYAQKINSLDIPKKQNFCIIQNIKGKNFFTYKTETCRFLGQCICDTFYDLSLS